MKLINDCNAPAALMRAVRRQPYNNEGTLSVTTLLRPAQQVYLEKKHSDDIAEKLSDKVKALNGSAKHYVIELAADSGDIVESRFFGSVDGHAISAQIDLFELSTKTLYDFKFTSVWKIKDALANGCHEWEAQMNVQRYLMDRQVYKMAICAVCQDWRSSEAKRYTDYPMQVEVIPIDIWSKEQVEEWLKLRVAEHTKPIPSKCTKQERWYAGEKWAVMKKGRKSAVKLYDEAMDAEAHASTESALYLEHRPGTYRRCEDYCSAKEFCEQWKETQHGE